MAANNATAPVTQVGTTFVSESAPPPTTAIFTSQAPPQTSNPPSQPPPSSDPPSSDPPSSDPPSPNAPSQPPSSNPPISAEQTLVTSVVTRAPSTTNQGPIVVTVTSSAPITTTFTTPAAVPSSSQQTSTSTSSGAPISPTNQASSGTSQTTTIAVAVVVPLVAVALLVLAGIFFWRKRKQRKNNEEMRKAEINDYIYNPNSEPPSGGMRSEDGTTMREAGSGYRGWGTTSTQRKMSTSASSPPSNMARSNSGNNGPATGSAGRGSEGHSGDPLVDADSPQAETVGALGGAPVAGNRAAGVNRGPSNASSAYSGANRSEVSGLSGEGSPQNNISSPQYYNDMAYPEEGANGDGAYGGQPVIRDVSARRNTRIENPSVFPQQGNAGISQNF